MVYGILMCSTCGGKFHEVQAHKYNPDKRPNGTWFRLLPVYRRDCWGSFPENDPAISGADLACPACGSAYMNIHNRVTWHDGDIVHGRGPEAFKALTAKPKPIGAEYSPDFDFFIEQQTDPFAKMGEITAAAKATTPHVKKKKNKGKKT